MPRDFRKSYVLKDGTRAPGVTSILGIINKPFLIPWANRLGLQGIDSEEFTNTQKRTGTLLHDMIHQDLQGAKGLFGPDATRDYTGAEIAKAKHAFEHYIAWKAKHAIEPALMETAFVSETYRYGGTIDFYGRVDGALEVVDFTAGKNIYSEKLTQAVAYQNLLIENGHQVDGLRAVRFPREAEEGAAAEDKPVDQIDVRWELFLLLLEAYPLLKKVG